MQPVLNLIVGIVAVLGITGMITAFVIFKSRNTRRLNMRDASLTSEELEDHARKIAIEHTVSKRQNFMDWPVPRLNENYEYIMSVYRELNEDIQKKYSVPPSAEWLLDNFYIIEEQVKGLRRDLDKKSYSWLPVLRTGKMKGFAMIFAVAVVLVAHTDGQIDEAILSDYLKAYQSHSVLFDREIWAMP
ncbi:MAG: hypothetical protein HGA22_01415, partial [Clostridiales bacterium]|nr:hypothetical protein [Clostridiales bacterium]